MTRASVFRLLLFCATMLLIGSIMPNSMKVALRTSANHRIIHPLVHVVGFALFTFLGAVLAKTRFKALAAPLAAITFGFVLEFLEHVLYHQPLEISDIRLDSYGALIGYLVCLTVVGGMRTKLNTISG